MSKDPWTNPNPQPGDFDADLASLDPGYVEYREGDPDARLLITVSVQGGSGLDERGDGLGEDRVPKPCPQLGIYLTRANLT